MTNLLVWVVTVLYTAQSMILVKDGNYPGALVFISYAMANIGLIWSYSK
jgi:hypothetical protein